MLMSSNLQHASGSEGKHWGENKISLPAATYKMEPVFVSQKISDWRRPGKEEEIRSAAHLLIWQEESAPAIT